MLSELFVFGPQDLQSLPSPHREDADVEENSNEPVLRYVVFHHEESAPDAEDAHDISETSSGSIPLQLVEGVRTSHGAEDMVPEWQINSICLNQSYVWNSGDLSLRHCQHPSGEVQTHDETFSSHVFL